MHSVVRTDSQISCHTCEWAMSQMWMSHVTCVNDYHVTCHNIWMIHVTHSMETRGQPQAASPRASTVLFWLYVGGCSSFRRGTWLIHMCALHQNWHLLCCFAYMWSMFHWDVAHDSIRRGTWLMHMCALHPNWHLLCCFGYVWGMPNSDVARDSFICLYWILAM